MREICVGITENKITKICSKLCLPFFEVKKSGVNKIQIKIHYHEAIDRKTPLNKQILSAYRSKARFLFEKIANFGFSRGIIELEAVDWYDSITPEWWGGRFRFSLLKTV